MSTRGGTLYLCLFLDQCLNRVHVAYIASSLDPDNLGVVNRVVLTDSCPPVLMAFTHPLAPQMFG